MSISNNSEYKLFNHVNNGVMVLDEECKVLFWNDWLYINTGVSSDDIVSRELSEVFPEIKIKKLRRKMMQAKTMKAPAYYQGANDKYLIPAQLKTITGLYYDMMQQDATVTYLDDKYTYLVTIYDCTPYLEIERKLNRLAELNEKHSQTKSEFLAHTSHELRTPLNSILGFIELLKSTRMSEDQLGYLNVLQDSSNAMLDIVNSVMSISEVEKGVLEYKPTECSIYDTVKSSAELFYAKAMQKSIRLVCYIDPALPSKVFADASKIRQILLNFLSNAIKFTPDNGTIYIKTVHKGISEGFSEILFSVSDTGVGMNKEFIDKIFTPYEREQTGEYYEGSGVGLYICSKFAELMQSEIKVKSIEGEGSEFSFTVSSRVLDSEPEHYEIVTSGEPLGILIPEGSGPVEETLKCYMSSLGIEYRELSCIHSSQEAAAELPEVIIITECMKLCESIDNCEVFKSKKIICLSDSHCDTENTSNHIDTVITYRGILDPRSFELVVNEAYKAKEDSVSASDKRVLVMEDNYNNQMLMKVIFEKLGAVCDIVSNGESGLMYCKQNSYSLILIDINMPIKNGLETMEALKLYAEKNNVSLPPVYALTAHALKEKQVEYLSYGFDGYLVKPISVSTLKQLLYGTGVRSVSVNSTEGIIDHIIESMCLYADIENDDVERLLDIFFKSIYNDLSEIEQSIHNGDDNAVKSKAHYIKGQFLNFYLSEMASDMENLEEYGSDIGVSESLDIITGIRARVKDISEQLAVYRSEKTKDREHISGN